jgi:hypothetical protein
MKGVKRFNIPNCSVPERRALVVSVYMISNHCEIITYYLNSHSIRDCCIWIGMCCSCSEHTFCSLKKKVTDWYILVHQHVYKFWMHSSLHFLLLSAALHCYTKHNLSSCLHGNKFHNIMNRILSQLAVIWKLCEICL